MAFSANSGIGSTHRRPSGELPILPTRTAFPASSSAVANWRSSLSSSGSESKMSKPNALGRSALAALTTLASSERFQGHRP